MAGLIEVVDFSPADVGAVARLCLVAREESGLGAQLVGDEAERIEQHLDAFSQLEGAAILLAYSDHKVIGFALIRALSSALFFDRSSVYMEAIYVEDRFRRRGAGHALLNAVCDRADAVGATDIYAIPLPGARGVQRFLARLGVAPAGAHRVVPVSVLQRNLSTEINHGPRMSRSLEDLIARRRRSRTELHSGPLDLRAFQASLGHNQLGQTPAPTDPSNPLTPTPHE